MIELESQKPRIAETLIAAFYLSHFFSALQTALLYTNYRWPRSILLRTEFMNGVLIAVCLTIGIGLLFQHNWARIAGLIFSLFTVAARWSDFPMKSLSDWATVALSTLFNGAIIFYFARLWWRARAASNAA
jgi:hypothetical protein